MSHKPSDLEAMASDRLVWKTVCDAGLTNFMSDRTAASDERRATVIWLQQSQGQVLDVLSVAEFALLGSGCRVTYGLISSSRATLNSSIYIYIFIFIHHNW